MATCDQSGRSTDESEQIKYVCCSLCLEDGSRTAARHYCVDCEVYYCGKCVKYHNKIPTTKSHHVNNIESSDKTNVDDENREGEDLSTETLRCPMHDGKIIDTYCKKHDEVCCGTCAVIKHRLCTTESIDEASKDFNSSTGVNTRKEAFNKVLIQLKREKEERKENIDIIDLKKQKMIDDVDKYEEKIIKKVKEMANISRKEIRSKYDKHKAALEIDVQALEAAITNTATYADKLELPTNGSKLFATVKTSQIVLSEGERLLQEIVPDWTRALIFHFDKTLENTVEGMKAFGDCFIVNEYKAELQKTVNIQRSNKSRTNVYDMCFMESGDLILTDANNKKLKRFNSDLLFEDEMRVSGDPVAVCTIGKYEVAVRSRNTQTVEFVSVDRSMKVTSSFTLTGVDRGIGSFTIGGYKGGGGYGMAYDAGAEEIFACEGNTVSVYNKTGNKLRTYDKDTNGEPMFSACRQIALSDYNKDIYVTNDDQYNSLTVLDRSGQLKMKASDIWDAWPVCLLPGHICLVGSKLSGKIVQVNKEGKQIGTLINDKNNRITTGCVAYDHKHSTLIVGGEPGVISVYTLSCN